MQRCAHFEHFFCRRPVLATWFNIIGSLRCFAIDFRCSKWRCLKWRLLLLLAQDFPLIISSLYQVEWRISYVIPTIVSLVQMAMWVHHALQQCCNNVVLRARRVVTSLLCYHDLANNYNISSSIIWCYKNNPSYRQLYRQLAIKHRTCEIQCTGVPSDLFCVLRTHGVSWFTHFIRLLMLDNDAMVNYNI